MSTKICKSCQCELDISNFRLVGKYYRNTCKKCESIHDRELQIKLTEYIQSFKISCAKCGENQFYKLDFHHKDSEMKELNISKFCGSRRWSKKSKAIIDEEIKKCIVLCANCHREFHYLEKNEGYIDLDIFLKN